MKRLTFYLCLLVSNQFLLLPRLAFSDVVSNLTPEEVPPIRLINNLRNYLKTHPNDDGAYYELGRVYSVLYMTEATTITAAFKSLPHGVYANSSDFGEPIRVQKGMPDTRSKHQNYLRLSLENYKRAIVTRQSRQDKKDEENHDSFYLLGYGWMLEQGIEFAKTIPAPFKSGKSHAIPEEWRQAALARLRKVYKEDFPKDFKNLPLLNFMLPAQEAAESIIRLQASQKDRDSREEVATMQAFLKQLKQTQRAISPIIFPLQRSSSLSALLNPKKTVGFDLMGDRKRSQWSWVNKNAGILVWDPFHTGKIRSGYQLFGNVTWCMIWNHGYQPLARLDENGDGWLTGRELKGLAVWCDQNENGVSDRGEVRSLNQLGIVKIAVHAGQQARGIYWNPKGIGKRDGTSLPTYDWIAEERTPTKTLSH